MLAVIAIPDFDAAAAGWIAALRAAHDPLQDRVAPHVTLVFPQAAADRGCFLARVADVAAAASPFEAAFDRLGRMDDPHHPKYRFLNVLYADAPAAARLTVLHAALNDAPAADYAAHVTVARFGAVYSAKALERQIGPIARPAVGRIGGLQVMRLENGRIAPEATFPFAAG
jgi:2'-5' RNA ligase